jgi:hypothetical protein
MSGEIVIDAPALSGSTLFALLFSDTGLVWDSVDEQDEAFANADLAQYAITIPEKGTQAGFFAGDMPPNVPASMRWYSVRRQAGGSPAVTDPAVGGSEVRAWTGTAWLDLNTLGGATAAEVRAEMDANSTQLAKLGEPVASLSADLAAVKTDTAAVLADTAAIQADTAAVLLDTGTDGVVVAAASKSGYALSAEAVTALLSSQLTEDYSTVGGAPTLEQALMGILQRLIEHATVGTTVTVNRLDGVTPAMTLTLDDAVNPTSSTRAT